MAEDETPETTGAAGSKESKEPEWKRKQRLARIFGDVLPETTQDEREPDSESGESASDRWLKSQVPPHHGG
ncbi:hypothetical protein J2S40_004649 [Nocardioides luteus]|uniref:Uncharacterized protein n=1 Tax=Nocardioides luteus TaxID=1844 RepID=A0ABQ5SZW5_9ACTN|nr:hypothetical protein [Nocardioides luteus]MDR7313591.1 hypothetical protein [Nocardioides luteus]GGR69095.1 hypothetical protein GCM10010197_40770 [Nocardioides luteus]GLJ69213.1 hypothetical protein GCM10017579_32490 [Nocardioides luteus]